MGWRSKSPTARQLQLIEALELDCGVEFTGTTRGEACDYISAHLDGSGADDRTTEHEDLWWSTEAIFDSMWGGGILDQG